MPSRLSRRATRGDGFRPRPARRVEIVVVGMGLITVLTVCFVISYTRSTSSRNTARASESHEIAPELTTSHIWIEELLSGDTSVDPARQVHRPLAEARQLCRALVDGGTGRHGQIEPLPGAGRHRAMQLCDKIDALRLQTEARLSAAGTGPGTSLDQSYDQTFEEAMAMAEATVELTEDLIEGDEALLGRVNAGLATLLAVLFTALFLLVRRSRRLLGRSHEEGSRLALLVDSSDDAILGWTGEGEITSWNAGATRLYGYEAQEMLGTSFRVLVPPHRMEESEEMLRRILGGDPPGNFETERVTKSGELVHVSLALSAVRDSSGRVVGGVSIARDMTDKKRANEALALARDEALEASRLKSEFLATMSHEIRTPMNAVIGLSGLMLGTDLDSRQREYGEGIRSAGEALLSVINDILDFSKIESGKLQLEKVDFDLRQVIEEVGDLLAGPAHAKGLELLPHCEPGLSTAVHGDVNRVRQVLLNLVSNAVKFTPAGEVVVRARTVTDTADAVVVRIDVSDTGVGLTDEEQDRLFQPFSQADASTTRRFGGTGLGLAISRQLVEAMGGQIGVDSQAGRGSTFWCSLPFERQAAQEAPAPAPTPELQGLRVLVVDDNQTNRLILEQQLQAWRVDSTLVDSGQAALDHLRRPPASPPFDVVLLDLHMPGMDGLELARRIAEDPGVASPRLVLLSSAGDVDAGTAGELGILARLTKPVRQGRLRDCLVAVMTGNGTDGKPATAARATPTSPHRQQGRQGKVLVAEDNDLNQTVALGLLSKLGYETDLVVNGADAVEAVASTPYAAVLMDCHMPEMDGYQATREIRLGEGEASRTPVIAMTAAATAGEREKCLAAGMDDYVSKPVDEAMLAAVLSRWVVEAPAQNHVEATEAVPPRTGDPVDRARLAVLRQIGPSDGWGLMPKLVSSFLSSLPEQLRLLTESVGRGDGEALERAAHKLKGSAGQLGAMGLAELCGRLEDLGTRGDLVRADELLPVLHSERERVEEALSAEVAGFSNRTGVTTG